MTDLYFNVTSLDHDIYIVTHDKLKQKHGKADATFDQFEGMLNNQNYTITVPHPLTKLENETKGIDLKDEYAKLTYMYTAVNTILVQFNERIKKSFFRVFIEFFYGKKITKINEKGEALIKKCNLEFVKLEEAREQKLAEKKAAEAEAERVRQTIVVEPIKPPPADGSAPSKTTLTSQTSETESVDPDSNNKQIIQIDLDNTPEKIAEKKAIDKTKKDEALKEAVIARIMRKENTNVEIPTTKDILEKPDPQQKAIVNQLIAEKKKEAEDAKKAEAKKKADDKRKAKEAKKAEKQNQLSLAKRIWNRLPSIRNKKQSEPGTAADTPAKVENVN